MDQTAAELGTIIDLAARHTGQRLSRAARKKVAALAAGPALPPLELMRRAWEAAGLAGAPELVSGVDARDCPFLIKHRGLGLLVVTENRAEGTWAAQDAAGNTHEVNFSRGVRAVRFPRAQDHREEQSRGRVLDTAVLVLREVKKHRGIFVESLLATFLVDLIGLATSLFSMQVYDRVIPSRNYDTLLVLGVGVGLALVMGFVLNAARSYVMDKTTTKIDTALSNWFYLRALGIRMESRPASVGAFAAQLKGLEMLRGILCSTSLFVIADVPFALLFIAVIFMLGGPLGWVPVVLFPVALCMGFAFQRLLNRLSMDNQREMTDKTGLLVETLDGIESIKANGTGGLLASRWSRMTDSIAGRDASIKFLSALSSYVTALLQQLGYVTVVAFGAYLVTENQLTTGALLACSIISSRALSPVGKLPAVMLQWANLRAVKKGLDKLLARPNELDEEHRALSPEVLESSLRMEQVEFRYLGSERKALTVPKLFINPGERVGVVGAIGSGKSTLLKLASGLYRPRQGRVFLGGVDASQLAPARLRQAIAYIPQEVRLQSGTLRDNLLQGLPDPGDGALLEAVNRTGLVDMVHNHPKGLFLPIEEGGRGISGGQRQLIALTRLLLARPAIILLDEPTANMDAATEAKVVALLDGLAKAGATLVIATHRTAILPILDRLLVFENGMFAVDGPRELVLAKLSGKPLPTPASHSPLGQSPVHPAPSGPVAVRVQAGSNQAGHHQAPQAKGGNVVPLSLKIPGLRKIKAAG